MTLIFNGILIDGTCFHRDPDFIAGVDKNENY
jgi:hypothetical protein